MENTNSYIPYEKRVNHNADFRVKYKFRPPENGGRKNGTPYQGYRSDFSYYGEENINHLYMIHPEFENDKGEVITQKNCHVPESGTARMWIVCESMREFHYNKIKVGTKGYFREGANFVADCEVIEILDLKINPTKE